jgi:phosphatidylglycerophosphatase A
VCGKAGRDLGVADHGGIVWDEVVAIWLVLALVPATPMSQLAAFLIFRFFDILKPPPIRHFDTRWKNGFGVMFDDLLAALYTLLLFAIWIRITR